jgi:hypothetical protein
MADSVEKKPVQVMIAAERKRRWKREAEERVEYRSLTDLVVTAVENELRDEPVVGGVEVDLEDAHDRLDTIKELMDEMEDTVDETYTLVRTDKMGGYEELKNRIQDMIPLGDREDILSRTPEQPPRSTPADELEAVVARTGSVSHLARLLQREGYRSVEIKGAVEQLADDVEVIEATFAQPQQQADKRIYRVED